MFVAFIPYQMLDNIDIFIEFIWLVKRKSNKIDNKTEWKVTNKRANIRSRWKGRRENKVAVTVRYDDIPQKTNVIKLIAVVFVLLSACNVCAMDKNLLSCPIGKSMIHFIFMHKIATLDIPLTCQFFNGAELLFSSSKSVMAISYIWFFISFEFFFLFKIVVNVFLSSIPPPFTYAIHFMFYDMIVVRFISLGFFCYFILFVFLFAQHIKIHKNHRQVKKDDDK